MVNCIKNNWDFNDYLKTVYSFRANGNLYLLSYEDCDDYNRPLTFVKDVRGDEITRNLYLYKLDNTTQTWTIASDVVKTDYKRCNSQGKQEYSYYYPFCNYDLSGAVRTKDGVNQGSIKVLDNGNVEMIIIYFDRKYDDDNGEDYFQWMKVTFTPTNNNNYKVKQ
jgi:hypothetical protein